MSVTTESPFTSLRGWLWLLVLCLALGPTPVADPSSFRPPRPTSVMAGTTPTGTSTLSVPRLPSTSLDGPPKHPPRSYSPRVSLCWDAQCETTATAPRRAAKLAKSGPSLMRARITRLVRSSLSRRVRRMIERLAQPPLEHSVGLLTLRTGGKISVPPCAWIIPIDDPLPLTPLPTPTPTRTTPEHVIYVPTTTIDTSIPAPPTTSRERHRGSVSQDGNSAVLWIVAIASGLSLGLGVCSTGLELELEVDGCAFISEPVVPIAEFLRPVVELPSPAVESPPPTVESLLPTVESPLPTVDPLSSVAEPQSPPPTALEWAIACEDLGALISFDFFQLIDQVDIKVQLGAHLTIPGQRRQLLFYRSDGSFFEKYRTEFDLEELMDWAFAEAQYAVGEWYPEVSELGLGATIEVCVQVTTTEMVAECEDFENAYIDRVDSRRYKFCLCVEIPGNAPVVPDREPVELALPNDPTRSPTSSNGPTELSSIVHDSEHVDRPTSSSPQLLIERRSALACDHQSFEVTGIVPGSACDVPPLDSQFAPVLPPQHLVEWPIASAFDQSTDVGPCDSSNSDAPNDVPHTGPSSANCATKSRGFQGRDCGELGTTRVRTGPDAEALEGHAECGQGDLEGTSTTSGRA